MLLTTENSLLYIHIHTQTKNSNSSVCTPQVNDIPRQIYSNICMGSTDLLIQNKCRRTNKCDKETPHYKTAIWNGSAKNPLNIMSSCFNCSTLMYITFTTLYFSTAAGTFPLQ